MIRINLLPEERRQQEGTPLPRRIAIFAGAGILTVLFFMVVIQRLKTLPDARRDRKAVAAELADATTRIQREVKPLKDALGLLKRREEILAQVREGTLRWGPRLDGVQQSLTTSLTGVWVTAFSFEEARARGAAKAAEQLERRLTITFAASDFADHPDLFTMSNEEKIAQVTRSLMRNRAFSRDVLGVACPSWAMTDDYLEPPWNVRAITFPLQFLLTPPAAPEPPKPAPAPAAAKKG